MVKTNEQVKMYMMRVSYTNIFVLVVILISLLDGISPVFSLYEYKPGKYDNGHPYIQATPSHVFYRDDNIYYNDTVGLSEDFQFDKIKPLYLEELNQGIISTSELYEKAHWNIDVSIVQKNSGGGGGVPCPPTLPYCNIPTGTSSYTLLTDESDEEQLYKLYVIHNSLGAPSGTTYLRIITYSSSTYGITAIELSTTITNITNFVRLNRNKLLIIAIALRLNDTAEDNHIEATLSVTLSYGSTVLYNSSKSMIYKNKAWAILHTYLWIPDSINENADFSSLTIRTLITTNQYLENMKIDFDFVNLYLATISSFLLVFPLSRTMLIKSLITYTADVERNWYNPDGAYEYGTALASLANKIKSLLDHKEYILITLGRAYVIRLIELPRVLYSDNNEKKNIYSYINNHHN